MACNTYHVKLLLTESSLNYIVLEVKLDRLDHFKGLLTKYLQLFVFCNNVLKDGINAFLDHLVVWSVSYLSEERVKELLAEDVKAKVSTFVADAVCVRCSEDHLFALHKVVHDVV